MVQKLCDCECHKSYDFWRTCCGDAGIKEGDEATNQPVPQVCSKDLLSAELSNLVKKWDDKRIDLLHWRRTGPIAGGWEQSKIVDNILADLKELQEKVGT